jgi:hypothetical protein
MGGGPCTLPVGRHVTDGSTGVMYPVVDSVLCMDANKMMSRAQQLQDATRRVCCKAFIRYGVGLDRSVLRHGLLWHDKYRQQYISQQHEESSLVCSGTGCCVCSSQDRSLACFDQHSAPLYSEAMASCWWVWCGGAYLGKEAALMSVTRWARGRRKTYPSARETCASSLNLLTRQRHYHLFPSTNSI